MLGLTKKKLCEGICSEKTIGRLEANKTKPHIEVVRLLFEKMNLSGEYQRWQVVTNDVRAFPIYDEIGRCINNCEFERTENLLKDLENYISLKNPINKQFKERVEVHINLGRGMIGKTEARESFNRILQYTVPFEAAICDKEKYLTNAEILCLLKVIVYTEKAGRNVVFDMLVELCKQMEHDDGITEHIALWEIIMTNVANTYGSIGEFSKSNSISLKIMKECIYCYRMNMLVLDLYIVTWNNSECKKNNIPTDEGYQEENYLNKCRALCQLNKNTTKEIMVNNKLQQLHEK